jgi:ABC-type uncharacterized transport system substrate-binding protein
MLRRWLLVIGLAGISSITASAPATVDPARIEVILSQEGEAYQAFYAALRSRLHAALGDRVHLQMRVLPVGELSATLLVGAGIPASQEILHRYPKTPVVATLLSRQAAADALARHGPQRPAPTTALYLDQPADRYIGLIRLALPAATRLGVVYGPTSRAYRADVQDAARRAGLEPHATEAAAEDNIVQVLEPLLAKTDVLLVLPDPEVSSPQNVYPLLLATYRKGIPVIGFSAAYVKAGALAAVYSSPAQLGEQAADVVATFLRQGQRRWPASQSPRDFQVGVNRHVARSLGLTVPEDAELYRQLRVREGRP